MDSTLSPKKTDLQHGASAVPPAPQNVACAEELLAKLAQDAAGATTGRRPGTAKADFSAGPRLAAPALDIAPRPLGNEQDAGDLGSPNEPRSRGRRGMRGPVRFLLAVCIGVVATLAWQSYGAAGRHMIAALVPQLGLSSSPDMTQPSPGAVHEHPAAAAAQTNAADAAPAQTTGLAQSMADPVATPAVASAAPASAEAMQQIEAMAHDITAMRQSMEQLTAAQSQMASTIAALQAAQDARREQPAPPPRPAAARRPAATTTTQRAAQPLAPGPRPLSQSFTSSPGPPPPQPPRPPGSMP